MDFGQKDFGPWSPNLPNRYLLDLFMWSVVENKACATNVDAMKASVEEWISVPVATLKTVCSRCCSRLKDALLQRVEYLKKLNLSNDTTCYEIRVL